MYFTYLLTYYTLLDGNRSGIVNMDNIKSSYNLCSSGDIARNWKKWKQRWNLYALAGVEPEKQESVLCAILLHMTGEESFDICITFTFSQDEVNKIQLLIQKFDQHSAPKKNITYQRYLFHNCIQNRRSFDNF